MINLNLISNLFMGGFVLLASVTLTFAAPIVRQATFQLTAISMATAEMM